MARDGVPIFWEHRGPRSMDRQPTFPAEVAAKVKPKIVIVLHRQYIVKAEVKLRSLIRYFAIGL